MRRKIGVALAVLGTIAAIFGIVWITVIWPSLAKVPAGLHQQVNLQGTLTLYNADLGAPVTMDVIAHREYTALRATDDVIYLQEDLWFNAADTGQEIEGVRQQFLLGTDRVTRQNLKGCGDAVGGGHYTFPFSVTKDQVYPFWLEGNPVNLDAVYVDETDIQGLHVYVFEIVTPEGGLALPASFDTPAMRIDQHVTLYVEPLTGMPVYLEETNARTGMVPVTDAEFPSTSPLTYKEVTFAADNLTLTDESTTAMLADARAARSQIALGKNLLPWLSIGSGILLLAVGAYLAARAGGAPAAEPKPREDKAG